MERGAAVAVALLDLLISGTKHLCPRMSRTKKISFACNFEILSSALHFGCKHMNQTNGEGPGHVTWGLGHLGYKA